MRALLALATATAALTTPHALTVTLKIATDRNGAVDDLGDKAERFTSPASLDAVHRLRRHCDAVLVGAATVARDDPSLTVRRVPLAPRTAPRVQTCVSSPPTSRREWKESPALRSVSAVMPDGAGSSTNATGARTTMARSTSLASRK
jgi:hypothetical protein